MSAVATKRSLRQKKIINYREVIHGKKADTSVQSEQNDSLLSEKNASLVSQENDSLVSEWNDSCEKTFDEGSGNELFSEEMKPKRFKGFSCDKKLKLPHELNDSASFPEEKSLKLRNELNNGEMFPEEKKLKLTSELNNDELFLEEKKVLFSDELNSNSVLRRASITLKRVSVPPSPITAPIVDKYEVIAEILASKEDDVDEDANEYRLQRQKQMLDRQMMLQSINFYDDVEELKTVVKASPQVEPVRKIPTSVKRSRPVQPVVVPSRRRSERLHNRSVNDRSVETLEIYSGNNRRSARLNGVTSNYDEDTESSLTNSVASDGKFDDGIKENLNIESDDQEFLSSLKDVMNVPYDSVSDFTTCDFERFKETLGMCHMFEEPAKVITSRIVSMDFHPSENKLLILVGDKYGNVALRDLVTYDGVQIKGHQYNTNCLKFSRQNNAKFYSTSLDGTVRIGDINTNSLNLLFTSSVHTTWHHESGNTLYIGEGDGVVRILDLRSPNDNCPNFVCHKRSVRTVQTHPLDENYFLTSSGTGCFGVWDVRHMKTVEPKSIIMENFKNALTSAFYSAKGTYVLTTGNDDTIRVFDVADFKSKEITRISHNNHTGRWLSVFKATWQPQREDCFYVGSMMPQRRMQVYAENGSLLRELRSDAMSTVNSVITVHPTKPIIVGGNGSGKIHIFSPFRDLSNI